jgi:inner membrane protein
LDNLTHSLVGLFLARAGFKRATACGTAILVLAANAPDIDVISLFWGRSTALHWHRNITHSLVGAPFMALLTVAVVAVVALIAKKRKVSWWPAFWIALLGIASHLILDLTNVYGVRLLLPFSGHWSHLDVTPVVDFFIWAILLLGVVAPALSRLVGSEIGEVGKERGSAGWAVTVLVLLTLFDYSRSVFHRRATNILNSRIYNGLAPRRVGAFPSGNPLAWRGMAEMSNAYVEVPVDLLTDFQPANEVTYYKPPRTPAMRAAMETYPFQMLLEFVQWPLWVTRPETDSTRVSLIDLRFGTPSQAGFSATALVDMNDQVRESVFGLGEVKQR